MNEREIKRATKHFITMLFCLLICATSSAPGHAMKATDAAKAQARSSEKR
jgi:hypothetical protein